MADEDFDPDEAAANLSNEMTDAALTLIEEHGWTLDDVLETLKATVS